METTLSEQLSVFVWSCAFGVILGVFYEIFRFARLAGLNSKLHVYIQDIIFMCICSVLTFLFTVGFNKGKIRFFILLGELLGLLLYRYTIGEFTIKIFKLFLTLIHFVIAVITKLSDRISKKLKELQISALKVIKKITVKVKNLKEKSIAKKQSVEQQ